jgi:PAS domain S-box-containing protein
LRRGINTLPLRNAKTPEKRIQLLEGLLGAGTWTYDLRTRESSWSQGLYLLLGLDPNVISASFELYESLLHPDDRLSHDEVVAMARSGDLGMRRFRIIRPDGHMIWLESRTDPQYDRDGKLGVLHGVVLNITEQQRLRTENVALNSTVLSMRNITFGDFWRADRTGRLLDFSNWTKFTGQTSEQLKDYEALDAIHPEDRSRFLSSWETAIRLKQRHELSVRVRRHDGVYQRFQNKIVPVLDHIGAVVEWHGMSWIADEAHHRQSDTAELQSCHIRAARGLLDISARELASSSGVSFSTIRRMEADSAAVKQDSIEQVRRDLEARGAMFERSPHGEVTVGLASAVVPTSTRA